jgi:hypothetical protein
VGFFQNTLANVVASVVMFALTFGAGFVFADKTNDDDTLSKGITAQVDEIEGDNGGCPTENVVVRGRAHGALPGGYEFRLGIRGHDQWFVDREPLSIEDGSWVTTEVLGGPEDSDARFTLSVLMGRTEDFEAWFAGVSIDEGVHSAPAEHGVFILADEKTQRCA